MSLYEPAFIILLGGAAALLWRWIHPPERLVVARRGILDRRLGLGWILWAEIEGAYRMNGSETDGVRLRVRLSDRLASRLGPSRRRAGGRWLEVPLRLDGTGVSGVELLQRIQRHGCCRA